MSSNPRPQLKSLYDSLGVASNATTAEINIAFSEKKASLEPKIRVGDPSAASELVMWQEAHRTLTDFSERRRYDLMLADRQAQADQVNSGAAKSGSRSGSVRASSSTRANARTSVSNFDEPAWYENKAILGVGALLIVGMLTMWLMDSRSKDKERRLERELVMQQERAQQAEKERVDALQAASTATAYARTPAQEAEERAQRQERELRKDAQRTSREMESDRRNTQYYQDTKERQERAQREYTAQREIAQNRQREETERRRAADRLEKDRRELINILNADGRHHEAQKFSRTRAEELRTQECARSSRSIC